MNAKTNTKKTPARGSVAAKRGAERKDAVAEKAAPAAASGWGAVVAGGTASKKSEFKDAMIKKLRESMLVPEDGEFSVTVTNRGLAGIDIPYFDMKGNRTGFSRTRLLEDSRTEWEKVAGKKQIRYIQPEDSDPQVYFPVGAMWHEVSKDAAMGIMITEGEFKALCATKLAMGKLNVKSKLSIPCLGLGGVWMWRSKKNLESLIEPLNSWTWQGRDVYICFDSDAITNPNVLAAEDALAKELTFRGASVYVCRIRSSGAEKMGLDDYIVRGLPVQDLIDEASEWDSLRVLFEMNKEFVFVKNPGMVVDVNTFQRMDSSKFENAIAANRHICVMQPDSRGEERMVKQPAAKAWIRWPGRAEVLSIGYWPGQPRVLENGNLNSWTGWGCEPKKGDVQMWHDLLEYLFTGAPDERRWFEQWLAYPIQNPGVKMNTAVALWGRYHGTGKSTIGYVMKLIYGTNWGEIDPAELEATHNEWAERTQFIMCDEVTGSDRTALADKLKSLITRKEVRLNPKFIPSYAVEDRINYYFTSNRPDAFRMDDHDRRLFIHEVTQRPAPTEFYERMDAWLKHPDTGSAMFAHFLALDMTGFNPRTAAPMTRAKRDMIELSMSDLDVWVRTLVHDPSTVLRMDAVEIKRKLWTTLELKNLFDPEGKARVTVTGFARILTRHSVVRAANGAKVRTALGNLTVWAIVPKAEYDKYEAMSPEQVAKLYEAERKTTSKK